MSFIPRVKFPTLYHGTDLSNVDPGKVVDVEKCHIATDGINEALPPTREAARQRVEKAFASGQGKRAGKRGATLLFRETLEGGTVTDNNADVSERVNGRVFSFKVLGYVFVCTGNDERGDNLRRSLGFSNGPEGLGGIGTIQSVFGRGMFWRVAVRSSRR